MSGRFNRLTPQAVQQLKPGESLREHGIKVEKLVGDARWYAEFMHHRVRVHRVLGLQSAGWTRQKCEGRVAEIKAELQFGRSSLPKGRKTLLRLGELADWYLRTMDETGGKNLAAKRHHLQARLVPDLGTLVCDHLTEEDVGRYAHRQLSAGLSPSTVNRDLATLSHLLNTAVKRKKLASLPCRVLHLDEPAGRIRTLSDTEIERLTKAAIADCNADLWLFVEFGLNTAMRHSEIVNARFEDIDFANRRLYLPKAKAGARHQPITEALVSILLKEMDARDEREGWIFPARRRSSRSGRAYNFSKPFQRAVISAKLDPFSITPHVMRHTAITRLVEEGVPMSTIKEISGHKTIQMVQRYTHVSNAHVDASMDLLSASLKRNRS